MLQVPTARNKLGKEQPEPPHDTVKELADRTVEVIEVEIKATSVGRERFGKGTKDWPKFGLEEEAVAEFYS